MKISVITVAFNSAKTIKDTLASVAAQTHPHIEHIVIDGASSDHTLEQVRLHGQHVKVLISEPDAGIYDAMNKGLAAATGDYVGFLNADDLLASSTAVAAIATAASLGNDAVYGDLVYVRQDQVTYVVRHWRSSPFHASSLRFGWMPPHPTFYVKRSLVKDLGGFDISLKIAADYDFMMRCLTRPGTRAAYVPEVLVSMRMGGVSNRSIRSMLRKSAEDLVVMRRHHIGGWLTLASKNFRKLPQFLSTRAGG